LYVTAGAVLEANWTGDSRRHLPVALALGRSRPNGAPSDQVADVLRRDGVEKFTAGWQAQIVDVEQQLAGDS